VRVTWDDTWSEMAQVVAQRSRCCRSKVGAVIVSPTNKVLATGYNGPPSGWDNDGYNLFLANDCEKWCPRGMRGPTAETLTSYEDCPTLHAEMNALMYSDASERKDGSIYVTSDLCFTCAKAIANSGIKTVHVVKSGGYDHRNPERSYEFLAGCGIEVVR